MELTREVLEAVTLTDFNCLQGDCRGSACGFMRHTPGGDWLCEAPTPNELAACALELMAERDQMRAALEELLPLVMDYRDDGAYPEDWQSAELRAALFNARAALEPAQKEARDAEAGQ